MATKIDKSQVRFATAIVNERTAKIELEARRIQLVVALVKLATVSVCLLGALAILVLRL
jgi:hypothetical protein